AVVPLCLLVAWAFVGTRGWLAPSPAPLVLELVAAAAGLVIAFWVGRRWVAGVDERRIAAAAEARRGLPEGSVRGVLELSRSLPAGTSPSLYRHAEALLAQELSDATEMELSGELGVLTRRRRKRAVAAFSGLAVLVL